MLFASRPGVLSREFAFSLYFRFDCLLGDFWERGIKGALEINCFVFQMIKNFLYFFMFLLICDRNISHGKKSHCCSSVIAGPTPSVPCGVRCFGQAKGLPHSTTT